MSGRKNFLASYKLVTAGDMSLASVTSSPINIQGEDNVGVQLNILTGTPTGVFTVQVSADYNQNLATGNWINVNLPTSAAITSGSPSPVYIDLNQISAPWIRVVYTKTSGTGTFDAFICGKML